MRLENLELRCWNYVVRTTLLELRYWKIGDFIPIS
jgi:hypothetical protein